MRTKANWLVRLIVLILAKHWKTSNSLETISINSDQIIETSMVQKLAVQSGAVVIP
jgi:hypothetical protein